MPSPYDPISGLSCVGERVKVDTPLPECPRAFVPVRMLDDPDLPDCNSVEDWTKLRCRHDFEFWCATCVSLSYSASGEPVPFILNTPQRRILSILESDRIAGRPIRMIILKAKRWGATTLIQLYIAWMQLVLFTGCDAVVCASDKGDAANLRQTFAGILRAYPPELWQGGSTPGLCRGVGRADMQIIRDRRARIITASATAPLALAGTNILMAHISDIANWKSSRRLSPMTALRPILGAVDLRPGSLIVMESSANGVGNYFHSEWFRNKSGNGDKHAVFVPWYEVDAYRLEPPDYQAFARDLSDAELKLWDEGLTLDQIYWYRRRKLEYGAACATFTSDFPSDDIEAFSGESAAVLNPADVERLRLSCREPEVRDVRLASSLPAAKGKLQLWEAPVEDARYVVAVDVGGRTEGSDFSVAAVMKDAKGHPPEIVAQWRGHTDKESLARISENIARHYRNALLIMESNSFDSAESGKDRADSILERLAVRYPYVYRRDTVDPKVTRIGFHTNHKSKALIIGILKDAVKNGAYIERDSEACNELSNYMSYPDGTLAAKPGYHDDILMSRALALFAISHISHKSRPP